jgi:hypothetical protein
MPAHDDSGHQNKFYELIDAVRLALAPLTRPGRQRNVFILPEPQKPHLVFEILHAEREDNRELRRYYKPFVSHEIKWSKSDVTRLKENAKFKGFRPRPLARAISARIKESLEDLSSVSDEGKIQNGLNKLINEYEKMEIPAHYKASGVMWEAWQKGRLFANQISRYVRTLHLEFEPEDAEKIVDKLRRGFALDKRTGGSELNKEEQDWLDWVEWSLVHQVNLVRRSREDRSVWLLVHFPLIIRDYLFVGFAYFIFKVNAWSELPQLFDRYRYVECLFEFTKQQKTLEFFLKQRALGPVLENLSSNLQKDLESLLVDVAQRYFACFDVRRASDTKVGGNAELEISAGGVSVSLPAEWCQDKRIKHKLTREKSMEHAKARLEDLLRDVVRLRGGSLSMAFSLCFGVRAVAQITHPHNPAKPMWHDDEKIYSGLIDQVSELSSSIKSHESLYPDLATNAKWRIICEQWRKFQQEAERAAENNVLWKQSGYQPLRDLRAETFQRRPPSFLDVMKPCGPSNRVTVENKGCWSSHYFEVNMPIDLLLEGGLHRLVLSIGRWAKTPKAQLWHGACQVPEASRAPDGFREALFENYLVVGHDGPGFGKGFVPSESTTCADLLRSGSLNLLGRYVVISQTGEGRKARDFTVPDSSIVDPVSVGLPRDILELVKSENGLTNFHIFCFPAWRSTP